MKDIKVCIGCGHIEGDDIGEALSCCPENNHLPLRDFIKRWRLEIQEKARSITLLKVHNEELRNSQKYKS